MEVPISVMTTLIYNDLSNARLNRNVEMPSSCVTSCRKLNDLLTFPPVVIFASLSFKYFLRTPLCSGGVISPSWLVPILKRQDLACSPLHDLALPRSNDKDMHALD
jgi:hypothetical protein